MDGKQTILVTGGTGKTGRRIVERLAALPVTVRVGSRSGVPRFDWDDATTWDAALQGADAVYIAYQPDLAVPGAVEVMRAFIERAVAQGVRRMVMLTGRGEAEAEACERILQAAPVEWTILRAAWFNQNFSEDYLLEPVLAGEVALPNGHTPEPFIDVDDIADVAVAALTQPGHAGQLYELTGPRLLTMAEAVGEIASATGREIRFASISLDAYTAELEAVGIPADYVALFRYLFETVMDGRNASVGDGVQRALGRPARDFTAYAQTMAASGVWNVEAAVES